MSCFGGFRRISGLKSWEFGHVWSSISNFETSITAHRNQDQLIGKSHLCCAIHCTPDQRFKRTHYNLSQTFMCLASLVQCMYFRRFTQSQSHLQQIPPISFILPQLCVHGAFKITKQLSTEVVLSLTLHQIIPPLHSLSPPAVSGAPGRRCSQHPRRRPRRGAAPPRRCGR